MKTKRFLLAVLAVALICALSVAGTMALLAQQANDGAAVTNTFQAYSAGGNGKPLATTFTLQEHLAIKAADGSYTVSSTELAPENKNSYSVMPGLELKKDPFITITGKTEAPAYLFIEVVDELTVDYTWTVDSAWKKVEGAIGAHKDEADTSAKCDVYVYCGTDTTPDIFTADPSSTINIINGQKIDVAKNATLGTESLDLTFYAYLAQANIGENDTNLSYEAFVYNTCFNEETPDDNGDGNT